MKLTSAQKAAYEKLSKTEPKSAYDIQVSLPTLRALVTKGKAKQFRGGGNLGAMFSPRTAFKFLAL